MNSSPTEVILDSMKTGEKILVVEDNDALRAGLVLNLENRGYRVDAAQDGNEGLRKAIDTRPDLIVLDLMLPGRTGLEIVSELRRRRLGWRVPAEGAIMRPISHKTTTAEERRLV